MAQRRPHHEGMQQSLDAAIDRIGRHLKSTKTWEDWATDSFRELRRRVVHFNPLRLENRVGPSLSDDQADIVSRFLAAFGRNPRAHDRQFAELSDIVEKEVPKAGIVGRFMAAFASNPRARGREFAELAEIGAESGEAVPQEADVAGELRGLFRELEAVSASAAAGNAGVNDRIDRACRRLEKVWVRQRCQLLEELLTAKDKEDRASGSSSSSSAGPSSWEQDVAAIEAKFQAATAEARAQAERAQQLLVDARRRLDESTATAEAAARTKEGCQDRAAKRDKEARQDAGDMAAARGEAERLAASGATLEQLIDAVKGGDQVWVWTEDPDRWQHHTAEVRKCGSQAFPVVLFSQENWSRIEAQYMLYVRSPQAQGLSCITVHVNKLFNQQSGDQYELDFRSMCQRNKQSGFQRAIRRIDLTKDLAMQAAEVANRFRQGLAEQRRDTAAAAKAEATRAEEASRLAERARQSSAAQLASAERLRQGIKESVWDRSLPMGQAVGSRAGFQVATAWEPGRGERLVLLDGRPECQAERSQVEQGFLKTSQTQRRVLAIFRVQNLELWDLYVGALRRLLGVPPGAPVLGAPGANEDLLWHGARGNTDAILQSGFKVFVSRPQGVWMSPTSEYSATSFCTMENGRKRIFLVRAALGTIGTHSIHNGFAHIVPDGCRAYPAYVVEFLG